MEDFLLLMAIYNGTLGGLKYNANSLESVKPETVKHIEKNWTEATEISDESQRVFTDNFDEVISLSFDKKSFDKDPTCTGIFIGTSNQQRFDNLLENLAVEWSYISCEDEDSEDGF
ncbi:MAG: hypothetical protein MUD08_00255 [Cytophagales bacterium]|nr:hypothetical protein [Cytophagales bacterium]